MPAQPSPVTPDVLRWALDEDGRPIVDIADAVKVDTSTLEDWLDGRALPSRGQVTKLAEVLQRPRALFFLPRPPSVATLPPSFRHPPGDERLVSAAARRKVRQARRVQHAVAWALRDDPPIEVPRSTVMADPETAAAVARTWLGVTGDEQKGWSDERVALRAWREALEEQGVLVFVLEIGRDDVRGFSAWDDRAPLIVANLTGVTPAARSFTLAHELAHLIARQDSACIEPAAGGPNGAEIERWCERVGAGMLMPPAEVRALGRSRAISNGAADLDDVRAVMRQFRVSGRAAAVRLIDLGLGSPGLYAQVARAFVPALAKPTDTFRKPSRAVARPREYGERTIRTILQALPQRDAMSVLRVTVEDVRRMAQEVPGVDAP